MVNGLASSDEESSAEDARHPRQCGLDLEMTPMVDVTFLLLIFFMVTASFNLQKSLAVPRKTSDLASQNPIDEPQVQREIVELTVDRRGSFLVQTHAWERDAFGKQSLITTLKNAVGSLDTDTLLAIKVDEMASLGLMVDAIDAGGIAGFDRIELTQIAE